MDRKASFIFVSFVSLMCVATGCSNSSSGSGSGADAGDASDAETTRDSAYPADAPQLEAPQQVAMPAVNYDETAEASFDLQNVGGDTLIISKIVLFEEHGGEFDSYVEFTPGDGFTSSDILLEPDQSHTVSVGYTPRDDIDDRAMVQVTSNDPVHPFYEIAVEGPPIAPEIAVTPTTVKFGRVPAPGDTTDEFLSVSNTGSFPLWISDIYVSGSSRFHLSYPDPNNPGSQNDSDNWTEYLSPGESFDVRITFEPEDNQPETGELVIESDDPDEEQVVVDLRANSDGS
ncbi:choice-of-anchor D domain-containing protein [Persicimonas caeni]|uniref:Choice-of-anchor D domain-containing protein n=1 Tax=Persicimonas caeni TaxID=2292766 RepID=A0A4Y6PWR2_PERCE|nr:choice-of-anchor D domain-containing protein [Persicimonas caeni]QDG52185.1 choice-of-anchor D domain-containing protein [Persicimonas caeni]QED33407.1 choice-of-anchor D domain-containing protein [Persicimonas caeni]